MVSLRFIFRTIVVLSLVMISTYAFYKFKSLFLSNKESVRQDVLVSKITAMGKLELVKYSIKDVIDMKETKFFWPDERIIFVAVGEVTACIDLKNINKSDIVFDEDSLTLYLPKPEICYTKLDHNQSKVYDVSGIIFPDKVKEKVEEVYKIAEKKMYNSAIDMNILGKAKENAHLIFKPLVINLSNKKVGIVFK